MQFSKKSNYYRVLGINGISSSYVRGISQMSLISREREIELSVKISVSRKEVIRNLFSIHPLIIDFMKKFTEIEHSIIKAKYLFDLNKYINTDEDSDIKVQSEESEDTESASMESDYEAYSEEDPNSSLYSGSLSKKKKDRSVLNENDDIIQSDKEEGILKNEIHEMDESQESTNVDKKTRLSFTGKKFADIDSEADTVYNLPTASYNTNEEVEDEEAPIFDSHSSSAIDRKDSKKKTKKNIFFNIRKTIDTKINQYIEAIKEKLEAYDMAPSDRKESYLAEIATIFANNLLISDIAVNAAIDILKTLIETESENSYIIEKYNAINEHLNQIVKAKEHLAIANLRLVISVAKKYANRRVDFMDIIQEGNLGLMKAITKFDASKGFKFSTYATWWVKQSITRDIYDNCDLVRLPIHLKEHMSKILKKMNNRHDDTEANMLEGNEKNLKKILRLCKNNVNVHSMGGEQNEDYDFMDVYEDQNKNYNPHTYVIQQHKKKFVEYIMSKVLNEREMKIFYLRYIEKHTNGDMTLEVIGYIQSITRERVRQLLFRGTLKLYNSSIAERYRANLQ